MPVRKSDYWAGACHTMVLEVALYSFQLVVTETTPADLFTSPAASAFKKDGVQRARQRYIVVHFVYGVHDNYTNWMQNGALSCGDFGGKTPPPSFYFQLTALVKKKTCAYAERKIRSNLSGIWFLTVWLFVCLNKLRKQTSFSWLNKLKKKKNQTDHLPTF